jgi:hypothetical protein
MRYAIDVVSAWGAQYGHAARLAVVYIQEAHATDEWPISSARLSKKAEKAAVSYAQHRIIGDRLKAARDFCEDYAVPVDSAGRSVRAAAGAEGAAGTVAAPSSARDSGVCVLADAIGNGLQDTYAAWPIRWFIFRLNSESATPILSAIGQPEEASFDLVKALTAAGIAIEEGS